MRFALFTVVLPLAAAIPPKPAGVKDAVSQNRTNLEANVSVTLTGREGELPKNLTYEGETIAVEQVDAVDHVISRRYNPGSWQEWLNRNQWRSGNRGQSQGSRNNGGWEPQGGQSGQNSRSWGGRGEVLTFAGNSDVDYEAFKQLTLNLHNMARQKHPDTGPLSWNEDLAEDARKYSAGCVYKHGHSDLGSGKRWGQNIASSHTVWKWTSGPNAGQLVPLTDDQKRPFYNANEQMKRSFTHWWDWERFLYNWWDTANAASPLQTFSGNGKDTMDSLRSKYPGEKIPAQVGHFTQIVWRDTTEVGCSVTVCQPVDGVSFNQIGAYTVCNYAEAGELRNPLGVSSPIASSLL
ncbi:cysteine-rich secretory protein family protein [Hirsutella rhossiliensis]|uniref:Cysteine-rich secretory protein family domain-containing protein n=1 Tax=Hirsutella rhossiliensis TaxID=111463 RepID=A0A9P8N439_9HYPO|nr:cysteine-rich secretory protein family domain-containing protein [Hirsutella rhossiliensis]KAH0966232.1 cysteine-rich secretory protein family domain-containing protein [Hirsutella rhossiliensis]